MGRPEAYLIPLSYAGVDDRIFRELARGFQLQGESRQLCMKTYQNLASLAEYKVDFHQGDEEFWEIPHFPSWNCDMSFQTPHRANNPWLRWDYEYHETYIIVYLYSYYLRWGPQWFFFGKASWNLLISPHVFSFYGVNESMTPSGVKMMEQAR